jgi:rubrerythrin
MLELVDEVQLGITKGTELEKDVEGSFRGECAEVGLYLAMARQAQREGFPEIAEVLKTIACEEAGHAAHFAELNMLLSKSTKENMENMLQGEIRANTRRNEMATKAKSGGVDAAHDFIHESSRDEARHARMLEGLLRRYFA